MKLLFSIDRPLVALGRVPMRPLAYKESLIRSLIMYARTDKDFARYFRDLIRAHVPFRLSPLVVPIAFPAAEKKLKLLVPSDAETAFRRADWLMERLRDGDIGNALRELNLLSAWGRGFSAEEARGLFAQMTSRKFVAPSAPQSPRRMAMIVSGDRARMRETALMKQAALCALSIVARALHMSGGDLREIEPELGDWFFGERGVDIFEADLLTVEAIRGELRSLGVPHEVSEHKPDSVALAVSPVGDRMYQEYHWNIRALV